MNLDGFKSNVKGLDILVAGGVLYFAVLAYQHITLDIHDYFIVNKVQIDDHVQGSNAAVLYDRHIKKDFWAGWTAEVKSTLGDAVVCPAHGHHEYLKREEVDDKEKTLKWYLERPCNLPPGQYFINTTWELDNGLSTTNTSNVFRVYSQSEWDALNSDSRVRERQRGG